MRQEPPGGRGGGRKAEGRRVVSCRCRGLHDGFASGQGGACDAGDGRVWTGGWKEGAGGCTCPFGSCWAWSHVRPVP
eukprot:365146-Chlamydomonas_euryale.AAC.4